MYIVVGCHVTQLSVFIGKLLLNFWTEWLIQIACSVNDSVVYDVVSPFKSCYNHASAGQFTYCHTERRVVKGETVEVMKQLKRREYDVSLPMWS